MIRCLFWLLCALWATLGVCQAQQPATLPVPARPIGSLSPADTSFAELEFLRTELGGARVVFLGEPTHGEGNVLAAKARLVAFLQQRLGFTTLAMESGFFSVHKAQQGIAAGKSVAKNLAASVFPVWMQAAEFQPILPLLGGEGGLRVMGFDPQLSGEYSEDLTDDLEDFLEGEKGAEAIHYDQLDQVHSFMLAHQSFPPTTTLGAYEIELAKTTPLLARAANAPQASRRQEAAFWQQCVRSLLALARDYAQHDPATKTAEAFVAADSNPRDAQMAENLLWYLRQHPAEKVICWGALPHFANRPEVLDNDELRAYRPMGGAVRAALGPTQVYILGTLAGGGNYGVFGHNAKAVPAPAPGTLEASLLATTTPYAFVSLRHEAPGRQLTTYAFEYQPLAGPWSEVADGFLFFKSVEPSHRVADSTLAALAQHGKLPLGDTATAMVPSALSPGPGRSRTLLHRAVAVADVAGVRPVRGVVLDQRTRQPVPFASVQLPGVGGGTVADAQGHFTLALPGPTPLHISSLGYGTAAVSSPTGTEELTVLLTPAAYALADVRATARPLPTAEALLKQVVKHIPSNYEQQAYTAEVYTYQRVTSYDTVRLEEERVSQLGVPAGLREVQRGFLQHEDNSRVQPLQRHVLAAHGPDPTYRNTPAYYSGPMGYQYQATDPVRTAPLFTPRGARHYALKLDSVRYDGGDTLYMLSFVARRPNLRTTGAYLAGLHQGRLLVRQRNYAVLRYEALWQTDTAAINGTARKNAGKNTLGARVYPYVFTADRTTQVVRYAQAANGRYYVQHSTGQTACTGRALGRGAFASQLFTDHYFSRLPAAGTPAPPAAQQQPPTPLPPYRPEFWATYKRPLAP